MWVLNQEVMSPLLPFSLNGTPWHSNQSQMLPEIYVQNASLEMCWIKRFWSSGQISGAKVAPFLTINNEGFDINTPEDWQKAEAIIRGDNE